MTRHAQSDAYALAEDIRERRRSSIEVVEDALDRALAAQQDLNPFTVVLAESARAEARAADDRVRAGGPLPPLLGVPVSVKDHIWIAGQPATNGSLALRDFVPDEDAVVVTRLREAGAVVIGRTNNPEFCYRAYTNNALWGLTRNPWDPARTCGGSSGGAAVAVSVGATPIALGTDGGGSVRIPGSFSGVVGHKPTFGLVPKEPGFKGWKTLSVHGLLTRSVRDAALGLAVMAGASPADDLSFPVPLGDLAPAMTGGHLNGLRVAYSPDLGISPVDDDVRDVFAGAVELLRGLGGDLVEAAPPPYPPAALWNRIALVEGYASEGPLLADHRAEMTPGTAEIVEAGAAYTGADYVNALHEKAYYTRLWEEFFERVDLLVAPAMPCTAYDVDLPVPREIGGEPVDPFFDDWCALALPANLAGLPATCVPAGFSVRNGLPVGVQVLGPRWSDARTLAAAAALESAVSWQRFVPPGW